MKLYDYYKILRWETTKAIKMLFPRMKSKWMLDNRFNIYRCSCGHVNYYQKEEDELLLFLVTTEQEFVD